MVKLPLAALSVALYTCSVHARYVFFYDQSCQNPPNRTISAGIDHVITTFANPSLFTTSPAGQYIPFEDLKTIRTRFDDKTKVLISIGGPGNFEGFSKGAATEESRQLFAANVANLCNKFGFDGVDINWEYPGVNTEDYRKLPNSKKVSEIDTYPILLAEIRRAIGTNKLLTITTPSNARDMDAYTPDKAAVIWLMVDWVNIKTYDLMTFRDSVTKHHTDVKTSRETIEHYINHLHLDPKKINLGFAMYAKYFTIDSTKPCETGLGCTTVPVQSRNDADTGMSGVVTFEAKNYDGNPSEIDNISGMGNITETIDNTCGVKNLKTCPAGQCCSVYGYCGITPDYCNDCQGFAFGSGCKERTKYDDLTKDKKTTSISIKFKTAMANGITDQEAGGQYYYDRANKLFWTWDTSDLIARKFDEIVKVYNIGGVVGWSLGQDSYDFSHMLALQINAKKLNSLALRKKPNHLAGRINFEENTQSKIEAQSKPQKPVRSWWKRVVWPF